LDAVEIDPARAITRIWCSPISGRKFPADHDIRSRHTANSILKQAGITDVKIP